jgi:DNA-directed RNA polymerase specialized sigma subunit
MITGLTNKASRRFKVPADDMFGEAYKAFLKAFVHYNGTTRFSTFLYISVQRHISKACSEGPVVRIPRELRRLTMRVVDRMQGGQVSFDDAVGTEGLPRAKVKSLVASMAKVNSASELKIKESDMASVVDKRRLSGVMEAVESVKLGRLEKAVVKGFLEAPTGLMGLSKGCEGMINPNTGRPYSRAAISAAWKKAREKLANALKDVA